MAFGSDCTQIGGGLLSLDKEEGFLTLKDWRVGGKDGADVNLEGGRERQVRKDNVRISSRSQEVPSCLLRAKVE